jgi:hypothetical protein
MPDIIEGPGRYCVYQAPDGGWVLARAGNLCERCLECGCGEQAEQVQIPALVVNMAMSQGPGLFGRLKAMVSHG